MAVVSVYRGKLGAASQLLNGVFGHYDGQKMHIDPLLQRIYLLSLQPEIAVSAEQVDNFDVPDEFVNAFKANVLHLVQSHWDRLYANRAPLAGALESLVRAEQAQVREHCNAILRDLDAAEPCTTPVVLKAHIERPESLNTDEYESTLVSVSAQSLLDHVYAAAIDQSEPNQAADGEKGFHAGLESVDMDEGTSYEVSMSMTVDLRGDENERQFFVQHALPILLRNHLCDQIPVRILSYQEVQRDIDMEAGPSDNS